jgi:hypothetical protein
MAYSLEKHGLKNGTISDNYEFLFEPVNDIKTRFIKYHLETLKEYASECDTITEMGVDSVNTTWAFLDSRPKKLTSIDIINTKAPEIIALAETLAEIEGIDFEFILGDTTKIEIKPTEFLYIDTLHTYPQLKRELELHPQKVSKYIAFHDTHMYENMAKALYEFLEKYPNDWEICYETEESCGLTIIKRK